MISAIHSLKSELHDWITGVPGSLQKTKSGLQNIHNQGIQTAIKCVVGAHNMKELPDYVNFIQELPDERASLIICGMDYAGMTEEQIEKFKCNCLDVTVYLEQALELVEKIYGNSVAMKVHVSELPLCCLDPCYWSFYDMRIEANSMYDDSHWKKRTESIRDCFPMARACRECQVYSICQGIWRTQYEEYGEKAVIRINSYEYSFFDKKNRYIPMRSDFLKGGQIMKLEDRINIYSKKKGNTISFILNTDGSMERKSGVLCNRLDEWILE